MEKKKLFGTTNQPTERRRNSLNQKQRIRPGFPAWHSGDRAETVLVPGTPLHHPVVDGHDLVLKGNLWKPMVTWANPIYIYNKYNKS